MAYTVHTKNAAVEGRTPITYRLPRGKLLKLLMAHVHGGHHLLTTSVRLFVSTTGLPLDNSLLDQNWARIMQSAAPMGVPYFRPTLARTVFVEAYTAETGMPAETWDDAAAVMDNSVPTWRQRYNPSARSRAAQRAVEAHAQFRAHRAAAAAARMPRATAEEYEDDYE
jgi:hypothetical protein